MILHSDRGCQFTSEEYQRFLQGHRLLCSMSAVGSCADNAAAESFFGVLKRERVNRAPTCRWGYHRRSVTSGFGQDRPVAPGGALALEGLQTLWRGEEWRAWRVSEEPS